MTSVRSLFIICLEGFLGIILINHNLDPYLETEFWYIKKDDIQICKVCTTPISQNGKMKMVMFL